MTHIKHVSRRQWLKMGLLLGTTLLPIALWRTSRAADGPLLSPDDPAAKALKYIEDARKSKSVSAGNQCANCALYQGASGAAQGPCQAFPGKQVKAAGWCSSWAPQM